MVPPLAARIHFIEPRRRGCPGRGLRRPIIAAPLTPLSCRRKAACGSDPTTVVARVSRRPRSPRAGADQSPVQGVAARGEADPRPSARRQVDAVPRRGAARPAEGDRPPAAERPAGAARSRRCPHRPSRCPTCSWLRPRFMRLLLRSDSALRALAPPLRRRRRGETRRSPSGRCGRYAPAKSTSPSGDTPQHWPPSDGSQSGVRVVSYVHRRSLQPQMS
jgi:hypothetical protein